MTAIRALTIDYRKDSRPTPWSGLLVLALGVAAAGVIGTHYPKVSSKVRELDTQVRELRSTARVHESAKRPASELQKSLTEVRQANEIIAQLALPWNELFSAVESAGSKNMALLGIEPDAQKHRVKLTGEAKDLDSMLAYVRFLESQAPLLDVFLQSHQVEKNDPYKPVRFVVTATWVTR
jgi:Tfp pilus assembly protein PilN